MYIYIYIYSLQAVKKEAETNERESHHLGRNSQAP